MKDKKKILLTLGGMGAIFFLLTKKGFAEETTPEIEEAKKVWRGSGELIWNEVTETCKNAKQGVDGASIYITAKILEEPYYKECFLRCSTTTQTRMLSWWQQNMNLDLSSVPDKIYDILKPRFEDIAGKMALDVAWSATQRVALAEIASTLGAQTVSKAILSKALIPTGPIGWVIATVMMFLPTPEFLKQKTKIRISGGIAVPFPEESLRILKYINSQNAEFLFCCTEFDSKQEGLFILRRLLEIAEKTEPLSLPFGANKFLSCCRLSGFTSLTKPLSELDYTIAIFCQKFPAVAVPWDCTFEDTPVWLSSEQTNYIIKVGSSEYNRRWEEAVGRKISEPIELPTELPQKVSPVSGLPSYAELLYQKPVKPPMAIPQYFDIKVILCPECKGKGYIVNIQTKGGLFEPVKIDISLQTCPSCQGYGYIEQFYSFARVV